MANIIAPILIGLAVITPIYSGLYYFRSIRTNEKKGKSIVNSCFMAAAAYLFAFIILHNSVIPSFQSWFFDGSVIQKEELTEPDEGGQPYYETVNYFKVNSDYSESAKGGVIFLLLFILVGGFALAYYFSSQYGKKDDFRNDEYEDWGVKFILIVKIILSIALFICLLNMPYWYYETVRWITLIGCCYIALDQHMKRKFFSWLFLVCLAILFNPIYQITLDRLLWNCIDIVVGMIMLVGAIKQYIDWRR